MALIIVALGECKATIDNMTAKEELSEKEQNSS